MDEAPARRPRLEATPSSSSLSSSGRLGEERESLRDVNKQLLRSLSSELRALRSLKLSTPEKAAGGSFAGGSSGAVGSSGGGGSGGGSSASSASSSHAMSSELELRLLRRQLEERTRQLTLAQHELDDYKRLLAEVFAEKEKLQRRVAELTRGDVWESPSRYSRSDDEASFAASSTGGGGGGVGVGGGGAAGGGVGSGGSGGMAAASSRPSLVPRLSERLSALEDEIKSTGSEIDFSARVDSLHRQLRDTERTPEPAGVSAGPATVEEKVERWRQSITDVESVASSSSRARDDASRAMSPAPSSPPPTPPSDDRHHGDRRHHDGDRDSRPRSSGGSLRVERRHVALSSESLRVDDGELIQRRDRTKTRRRSTIKREREMALAAAAAAEEREGLELAAAIAAADEKSKSAAGEGSTSARKLGSRPRPSRMARTARVVRTVRPPKRLPSSHSRSPPVPPAPPVDDDDDDDDDLDSDDSDHGRTSRKKKASDSLVLDTPLMALDEPAESKRRDVSDDDSDSGAEHDVRRGSGSGGGLRHVEESEIESVTSFLMAAPFLQALRHEQLEELAHRLRVETFVAGEVIIRQGDTGDRFYLLRDGKAAVYLLRDGIPAGESGFGKPVKYLSAGMFFGERALMYSEPRAASVLATADCRCFSLSKEHFEKTLSGVSSLLGEYAASYSEDNQEVVSLDQHVSKYVELLRQQSRGRKGREAASLLRLLTAFSPELSLDDVIDRMMQTLYDVFDVARVGLFLHDQAAKRLIIKSSSTAVGISLPVTGLAGHVATTGECLNIRDCYADDRFNPAMDRKTGFVTRTMLCVPIRDASSGGAGRIAAVLQIINCHSGQPFTDEDLQLLKLVADQFGQTLAKRSAQLELESGKRYLPLWRLQGRFKVHAKAVTGLRQMQRARSRRLSARRSFSSSAPPPPGSAGSPLTVLVQLYHGEQLLSEARSKKHGKLSVEAASPEVVAEAVRAAAAAAGEDEPSDAAIASASMNILDATWDDWCVTSTSLSDMPRAARAIFTVMIGDTAAAWAGCTLFSFTQQMRNGELTLQLWDGACPAPTVTQIENKYASSPALLTLQFDSWAKPVVYSKPSDTMVITRPEPAPLPADVERLIEADPLYELTEAEKRLLWDFRGALMHDAAALPKFLQAVEWADAAAVREALQMMTLWQPIDRLVALQLLDGAFPHATVRAHAVAALERVDDEALLGFLLQLTQALKQEPFHDSALSRFLLRRSLRSPDSVGHALFWALRAEVHAPEARERYTVLLEQYLRHAGKHRIALGHQVFVMQRLEEVAATCAAKGVRDRRALLHEELSQLAFPPHFQLPLKQAVASGLRIAECKVMSSKKRPLWLVFDRASGGQPLRVLFKVGDDLRQDALALQLLQLMDRLWRVERLDLKLTPYGCVSTGDETGLIEAVSGITLADVVRESSAGRSRWSKAKAVFADNWLADWLKKHSSDLSDSSGSTADGDIDYVPLRRADGRRDALLGSVFPDRVAAESQRVAEQLSGRDGSSKKKKMKKSHKKGSDAVPHSYSCAVYNFMRSAAGYCAATFVLGIGDRHNDNIMVKPSGELFHIDYGHILGNFKSKMGVRRERAPFVFTPAFSAVLGKPGSPAFTEFLTLSMAAYQTLREHSHLLITLHTLMLSCGMEELQTKRDILYLRRMLAADLTDDEAAEEWRRQVFVCLNTRSQQLNDAAHLFKHS